MKWTTNRREFLQIAGGSLAAASALPGFAWAADGDTLRIRMEADFQVLDPWGEIGGLDDVIPRCTLVSLVRMSDMREGNTWELYAAEKLEWLDGTRIAFTLREGLNWTKGFGPVTTLVNNAGNFDGGPVQNLSLQAWDNVIGACLTGAFLCTRAAFRRMQTNGGGRILNIGSISAQRPRMHSAAYTSAKFGVQGLTHATALEGRELGISVSCLHPGNVLVERRENSELDSDAEPMMPVSAIVSAAMAMLQMPADVNFLDAVVLPRDQAYVGRG